MVKYIQVAQPIQVSPATFINDESASFAVNVEVKTFEVPDDIYIEKTNEYYGYGPDGPETPKVWLWFRWKGNKFRSYMTFNEYDYYIMTSDANLAAYHLIRPFIEMLQEDDKEVLRYFVREVAKIAHDFDVKKLMWLVDHNGIDMDDYPDTIYSDDGKAMGGYIKNDWVTVQDPYDNTKKYSINKDALKFSIPDKLKYHSDHKPMFYNYPSPATQASGIEHEVSMKSKKLPGMDTIVDIPCGCEYIYMLHSGVPAEPTAWRVVQHLNDRHRWTREKIADWLDELHDSGKINIEFDIPEGMKDE